PINVIFEPLRIEKLASFKIGLFIPHSKETLLNFTIISSPDIMNILLYSQTNIHPTKKTTPIKRWLPGKCAASCTTLEPEYRKIRNLFISRT
ncbi:hypothetical protein KKH26_00085, partial [Patescibacteria group bacterium]|nr:hypothetical protein [Patescibacteria group bacterium]